MPYRAHVFWSDEDDCYIAEAMDLEYCTAHGDSPDEALDELQIAMYGWLESCRKWGDPIPPEILQDKTNPDSDCVYLTPKPASLTERGGQTWDVR